MAKRTIKIDKKTICPSSTVWRDQTLSTTTNEIRPSINEKRVHHTRPF